MTDVPLTAEEVRQQLQRRRRETGEDFQQLLERYALDRFLFRLGKSKHRRLLALKGAVLFSAWLGLPHRPTRDVDFAADLTELDLDLARQVVTDVCAELVAPDGVTFHTASITAEEIREGASYAGARVTLRATIGTARIRLQVDIGFGDAFTPAPEIETLPPLLAQSPAAVLAYPRESVVAEKLEIITKLGRAHSRMKDYFDLRELAARFEYDLAGLADAVRNTFVRRRTPIPSGLPDGLSNDFSSDPQKITQWSAFLRRIGHMDADTLEGCVSGVRSFAMPVFDLAREQDSSASGTWSPDSGWTQHAE